MKMNLDYLKQVQSDENIISMLRGNNTEVSPYLSTINTQYNVGRTKMEHRYKLADKPVFVGGFVPQIPDSVRVFNGENNEMKVNLIDEKLDQVFKKHFKEYREL
jgi:hypothetical protein